MSRLEDLVAAVIDEREVELRDLVRPAVEREVCRPVHYQVDVEFGGMLRMLGLRRGALVALR
ncbi:MAG TPA: hypothetical protein VMT59_01875 [Gaiellaceae bacterium]|nr:hypothetical protein [Gaiellaceae bacterium]